MAMATVADLNGAMGMLKSDILSIQTTLALLQTNFQAGGIQLQDELEKKKAELKTMNDLPTQDMQSDVNNASVAFTTLTTEMAEHRTALMQQPHLPSALNVRLAEIMAGIQEKFGRQEAATNTKLEELERVFRELVDHVKVLEAKAASGDPWHNPGPPPGPCPPQGAAGAAAVPVSPGASERQTLGAQESERQRQRQDCLT